MTLWSNQMRLLLSISSSVSGNWTCRCCRSCGRWTSRFRTLGRSCRTRMTFCRLRRRRSPSQTAIRSPRGTKKTRRLRCRGGCERRHHHRHRPPLPPIPRQRTLGCDLGRCRGEGCGSRLAWTLWLDWGGWGLFEVDYVDWWISTHCNVTRCGGCLK